MSVIGLVVMLLFLAGAFYLVQTKVPGGWIKVLLLIVIAVCATLLVLNAFGIWDEIRGMKVPRL